MTHTNTPERISETCWVRDVRLGCGSAELYQVTDGQWLVAVRALGNVTRSGPHSFIRAARIFLSLS